jgi:hypothetical protein
LSRDESFCAPQMSAGLPVRCVRVDSPYEAAAELLSEATLALVIDLRCLPARHGRLVQLAARLGAEVIGCGRLSQGIAADAFSGMRLLAVKDLPAEMHRLMGRPHRQSPPPVEAAAAEVRAVEDQQAVNDVHHAARADAGRYVSQSRQLSVQTTAADVLTPQEVDALLGGRP